MWKWESCDARTKRKFKTQPHTGRTCKHHSHTANCCRVKIFRVTDVTCVACLVERVFLCDAVCLPVPLYTSTDYTFMFVCVLLRWAFEIKRKWNVHTSFECSIRSMKIYFSLSRIVLLKGLLFLSDSPFPSPLSLSCRSYVSHALRSLHSCLMAI